MFHNLRFNYIYYLEVYDIKKFILILNKIFINLYMRKVIFHYPNHT